MATMVKITKSMIAEWMCLWKASNAKIVEAMMEIEHFYESREILKSKNLLSKHEGGYGKR